MATERTIEDCRDRHAYGSLASLAPLTLALRAVPLPASGARVKSPDVASLFGRLARLRERNRFERSENRG